MTAPTPDTAPQPERMLAYLMVRTDMPSLGVGKGFAHSMHAGNHLTWKLAVEPLLAGQPIPDDVREWHDQGGGFGTTLSIGGSDQMDKDRMHQVIDAMKALGHPCGIVLDTSYPYHIDSEMLELIDPEVHSLPPQRSGKGWCCFREEETAAWVLGRKSELEVILRQFDLTPNGPF